MLLDLARTVEEEASRLNQLHEQLKDTAAHPTHSVTGLMTLLEEYACALLAYRETCLQLRDRGGLDAVRAQGGLFTSV